MRRAEQTHDGALRSPLISPALLEGWSLAPEGAAVFQSDGVAVIADVHLGYEWARGSHGDVVPARSSRETLEKLESLLAKVSISQLIVAGDLVESSRPCYRMARDVRTAVPRG